MIGKKSCSIVVLVAMCRSCRKVICLGKHKLRSATFMTFITGSMAESENVIAGMPPRFLVARLASKKGSETRFATKIEASAEVVSGSTELGNAKTSKTVMAIAKARHTAAQKAEAPTIAHRAMKAPRSASVGGMPFLLSSRSTSHAGRITCPQTRPSSPPMIMVGATTPAGMAEESAKIVVVHFIRKQRNMVPATPTGRSHSS
mmetsp:Transcript_54704/g.89191  ORF Transcript_54704/g.89191 Transcript_54704/m.89191 type:complete len:203 (+) Transcript_54704:375-983(+)